MSDEKFVLSEIAELLRVAKRTVYTLAQQPELLAFKIRGRWRFKQADLGQRVVPQ